MFRRVLDEQDCLENLSVTDGEGEIGIESFDDLARFIYNEIEQPPITIQYIAAEVYKLFANPQAFLGEGGHRSDFEHANVAFSVNYLGLKWLPSRAAVESLYLAMYRHSRGLLRCQTAQFKHFTRTCRRGMSVENRLFIYVRVIQRAWRNAVKTRRYWRTIGRTLQERRGARMAIVQPGAKQLLMRTPLAEVLLLPELNRLVGDFLGYALRHI